MRLSQLLKAKLHHARISYSNPDYIGSVEIDAEVMRLAGIQNGELVHIWAVDHDARVITYAFGGPPGIVGLNGGAAHKMKPGDRVIIAAFDLSDEPIQPKVLLLGENNEVLKELTPYSAIG